METEEIDIEAMVAKKYPVLPEEAGCMMIRDFLNKARHDYRLKLMKQQHEQSQANGIQSTQQPQG